MGRAQPESNRRPRDLQSYALPLSYAPLWATAKVVFEREIPGPAKQFKKQCVTPSNLRNAQNMLFLTYFSFFFILSWRFGTKNSAVYSMRGTLQYRFTTARVQWPCSTDIHWACLITQSGPARYVPSKRYDMRYELTRSGERVTGSRSPLLPTLRTSHSMA